MLKDPLFKPLSIFLLVASFSLLLNLRLAIAGGFGYSLFYLIRLFIYPSIYFSVKFIADKKILRYAMLSLIFFSSIAFCQYLFFPDMRYLKFLGYDDHYYRLIGSFYDPNFSGAIFSGLALIFVSLGQWLPALTSILLLALTFSRASYLVFFLGLIYLYFVKKNWKEVSRSTLFFYLFILASLVFLIPKPFGEGVNLFRTFSIFSRFDSWKVGFGLFLQRPLLGWGYNTLRSINGERFQIDNSYLYLATTTGIFGLLAFFSLLKKAFSLLKPLSAKLFIFTILTHSLFNNSLFYIWIYFAFWLALGYVSKEYKES